MPLSQFITGNLLPSALLWITSQLAAANQIPPDCIQQLTELSGCHFTRVGCEILASALLNPSHLRELDLSHNDAGDSSVQELCAELIRAGCKLEKLKLGNCCLTEVRCGDLALLLRSASSELRELELADNDLKGSGVKSLGLRRYL